MKFVRVLASALLTLAASVAGAESLLGPRWDGWKPFLITGILSPESILVVQDGVYFTCQLDDQGEFIDLSPCKPILTAGLRKQIATAEAALAEAVQAAADAAAASDSLDDALAKAFNSDQVGHLRQVIGPFWNIGSLSTEATRVTVTMRVQLSEDQKVLSAEMVEFTGGTAEAAQQAFEIARRAVIRGASKGLGLPPDNYESWKLFLITFDTSKGEIR